MGPAWRIQMLGGLQVKRGESSLTHFGTRKAAALLAYLAYFPSRMHPRETLMELLWPDEDPEVTRSRFRQTLSCLRQVLEPPGVPLGSVLVADRVQVRLAAGAAVTDVAEYEALHQRAGETGEAAERASLLERALQLYFGELLPGYYEDWIGLERERLAETYLEALGRLAQLLADTGDLDRALLFARRAVTANSLREEAHCRLMRLHAQAGHPAEALRQYQELERTLKTELRLAPGPAAQNLRREIERGDFAISPRTGLAPTPPLPRFSHAAPHFSPSEPQQPAPSCGAALEPVGGAVPLGSRFYLARNVDAHFQDAISRRDSIVLVKGPRQVGKSSLLARGLQQAREAGWRVVLTDFQNLSSEQLADTEALFLTLAERIAEELELEIQPADAWDPRRGWNVNFERYLRREVLGAGQAPLVWGMDEVDRLFTYPYGSEVFGLFRSWHNARSLNPTAPWANLTLAIAYATEAHLFITDLNQSPFNVGTRVTPSDFSRDQVAELNRRYGSPIHGEAELAGFYDLLAGHPYLVRRGLHEMALHEVGLAEIRALAEGEESPFSDHLRRLLLSLSQDPDLRDAVREVLQQGSCSNPASFYRLRSAGVLLGDSALSARPRCGLYRAYLERRLR